MRIIHHVAVNVFKESVRDKVKAAVDKRTDPSARRWDASSPGSGRASR